MKNTLIYSLLLLVSLLSYGCKEDEECNDPTNIECENYDPCYGQSPVTASFEMYEYAISLDSWLERFDIPQEPMQDDTTIAYTISFYAPEGFSKYTWVIGSERINERAFSRSRFPENEDITIMLIVEGEISPCFPDDDGIDTIVKKLFVKHTDISDPSIQYTLLEGVYQGAYIDTPLDTFTISITQYTPRQVFPEYYYEPRIYNLPPNVCDVLICDNSPPRTRNQMAFLTQGGTDTDVCGRPAGVVSLIQDSIDIRYFDLFDNEKFYHFRGIKLK